MTIIMFIILIIIMNYNNNNNNNYNIVNCSQLLESDRLIEYYKRNYTWPINEFYPNTIGFKNLILSRLEQVRRFQVFRHEMKTEVFLSWNLIKF
jgi:hypothetical protein